MEGNGWPRASCAAAAWPHELNRLDGSVLGPGLLTLAAADRLLTVVGVSLPPGIASNWSIESTNTVKARMPPWRPLLGHARTGETY